ncbi:MULTISPECIES: helix-turn-helix domain-containing protein [Pseudomonas aeruginosa group]|uniref:XRE family transcriptional regulator n=3 Tax=Pseudomonas aeruginosa group TaxID=136841 RepID=A0ABD7JVS0_PSEAI|nr:MULTISPECIES: helix-turn-helix transcriptional regulator [Pseudomonas aeruginosa group]ABR80690.1 putative transcriptional regulator [Pseudomonas aeruginosa PA7]AVK07875.1 helix-turn-helix domain protein [Pseudomonas paraeruginosa]AVR67033.1 XRE family transcriptional regulator [Pseudomonas paraeruginosa]AWE93190.1 helix-turn-helix domain protein [Pseudomonas paraeruginosa]KAB0751731.1 helix-turn-helix transcriptional regulator [Pseudomonas aeruginosa]
MNVQVITRDGEAEYAVLPWAEYQALLAAAGRPAASAPVQAPASAPAGASLLERREARGLSLEQVARDVGISPSYMAMIERGEREASEAIQFALERVLGKATGA